MPKFRVYGTVTGSAYLGEIEAESAEAAQQAAEDEHLEANISLCHHCSSKIEDPAVSAVTVEAVED
jgi:hypothetical protein